MIGGLRRHGRDRSRQWNRRRYGHLSGIAVSEGQAIEAGTVLGRISSTGRATGPHLHYEVRIDNEPVDPARFLRAAVKLASTD